MTDTETTPTAATHDVPIHVGGVELRLQDAAMIRATLKRRLRRIVAQEQYEWDREAIYSIVRILDLAEPDWRDAASNVTARLHNAGLAWHSGGLLGEAPPVPSECPACGSDAIRNRRCQFCGEAV